MRKNRKECSAFEGLNLTQEQKTKLADLRRSVRLLKRKAVTERHVMIALHVKTVRMESPAKNALHVKIVRMERPVKNARTVRQVMVYAKI